MNTNKRIKYIFRLIMIALTVVLGVIILNFGIHFFRLQRFNAVVRTLDNYSQVTDVLVDIHARGQSTDSWEKNDAYPDKSIYAKIYEATIMNNSKCSLTDWSLRVDISHDCWINNAWNGMIEIHQFTENGERVQKLSLQDYKESELLLVHEVKGQDLLIPLAQGDYFIYYPCTKTAMSEETIESNEYYNGMMNIGFIFYSDDGDVDLSQYELTYRLEKDLWSGTEPKIFLIMMPLWAIAVIVFLLMSILLKQYEKTIGRQKKITKEFLEAFADFVDSKALDREGHSRSVAELSMYMAKKLGMKNQDIEDVYYAALVHDIGKCYIADYLLKKKESELTNDETELLKQHTVKGSEMLKNVHAVSHLLDGALYHHERYDGQGYPTGKAGENIPLIGRIICVADSVAVANAGLGKDIFSKEDIEKKLNDGKGTLYDSVLVDVMIEIIEESEKMFRS